MLIKKISFLSLVLSVVAKMANVTDGTVRLFTDDVDRLNTMNLTNLFAGWDDQGIVLKGIMFNQNSLASGPRSVREMNSALMARQATTGSPTCRPPGALLVGGNQLNYVSLRACDLLNDFIFTGLQQTLVLIATGVLCDSEECEVIVSFAVAEAVAGSGIPESLRNRCQPNLADLIETCGRNGGNIVSSMPDGEGTDQIDFGIRTDAANAGCPIGAAECDEVVCDASNNNCQG